jgi:hypothetical protein
MTPLGGSAKCPGAAIAAEDQTVRATKAETIDTATSRISASVVPLLHAMTSAASRASTSDNGAWQLADAEVAGGHPAF